MRHLSIASGASARFRAIGPLGSGSYGIVYEALDTLTGQHVALKELNQLSAGSIARFKHEFRALADIHHPNLVGLKELIEDGERWLIVMELVKGQDLLSFVRASANDNAGVYTFDEARLRTALLGMAQGLVALHAYGVLHRDLKPSNVRITPEGRAVLLDFGLATGMHETAQARDTVGGTAAYMAPEQAQKGALGPAADWYALGVCLFEALTGQKPFEAVNSYELLMLKQEQTAPRASSRVPEVPADLDGLCAALLERAPEARPSASEVLRVLGTSLSEINLGRSQLATSSLPPTFAGRDAELQQLERALARTHGGELRIVLIEGESGVGKSELVAEFLRRMRVERPLLVPLYGRCYESEQVSYKAFDGCIDDLARMLRTMKDAECAALLPLRAAVLGQLFPVLRNVPAIAQAPRANISADPTVRRLEAFSALSALLSRLAEERPLVLWVDDVQWADIESFRLLSALADQSEPPPLLLLGTIRPREELEPDVRKYVEHIRSWKQTDVIQLLGLPPIQAEQLASKLLGRAVEPSYLATIARESEGHPLFLSELVQYAQSFELRGRGAVTLEAALRARIERLEPRARALLEIVALAARPYGSHVFARALSVQSVDEPATQLLSTKLLRLRKGHELGCFHDRIRHASVALIARSRLPMLHRQIATALAADPHADSSEQARHWDLAGEVERAVDAYASAARAAGEALAFMSASQLWTRAMELIGERDPRHAEFMVQRAHALARAGRSADAAVLYQRAADQAQGEARLLLRTHLAKQLLLSSDFARGFEASFALLREVGLRIPKTALGVLWHVTVERVRIALRGGRFEVRAPRPGEERRRFAYELTDQLAITLSILHPLAFVAIAFRQLRLAAELGISDGVAVADSVIGWFHASEGSFERALPLFERGRALCEKLGRPEISARQAYWEGSARLAGWSWKEGIECLERAHALLQAHVPDDPAQLANVRYHLGLAWYTTGEYARIDREIDGWLSEARERGDRRSIALLTGLGYGFLRHLMRERPDLAIAELVEVLEGIPSEPFSMLRFGNFMGMLISLLSQGGPAALRFLNEHTPTDRSSLLLRTRLVQRTILMFRALGLLASCEAASREERAVLIRQVRKIARTLTTGKAPFERAYARMFLAQCAALDGSRQEAVELARSAEALARANHLAVVNAARYLTGVLEDGHARGERCQKVLAHLRAQGWRDPSRYLAIALPAHSLITPEQRLSTRMDPRLLLDRFEVLQHGAGGFGTVIEAQDVQTGRRVAIKELVGMSGRSLERFKREFRALQHVPHPNLVRLDALLEERGTWYIAMELIEGEPLLDYVRPGGRCDPERVRRVFLGIARGVAVLHGAGFVHRDIAPENIRVTAEGRPVLVDFGFIARIGDEQAGVVDSVRDCAAPEQIEGATPTPSADVYALGVCLYRAMTGRLPAGPGSPNGGGAPLSRGLEELSVLCLRMIDARPEARPTLGEVIDMLSVRAEPSSAELATTFEASVRFSGRDAELELLTEASERACDEGLVLAIIEGESGVGKSALVSALREQLAASSPTLLALRSHCYENEQVALKAFDEAVDQLAVVLRTLPSPACEALLPKKAALLGQLFPVLTSVPAIAEAPLKGLPAEPYARKLAALECFVQLLETLTHRYELVFVIDDLQWADSESFRLLRMLLERRKSLPFLIVCTVRPERELSDAVVAELVQLRAHEATEALSLGGLSESAAAALARDLYGESLPPERLQRLVAESKGHPLFLRELLEQERSGTRGQEGLTLDQALAARIESFDADARTLLSLAALAGRPYRMHVLARAMNRHELPRNALISLLGRDLLQRRGEDELGCYHDRIRLVALARIASDERRELARRLASALDPDRDEDAAERARLWDEAGDVERAICAYEQAGAHALSGLAFVRAEQHFARALALHGDVHDERWNRLLVQHGQALVRVGRSAQAARCFQLAAAAAQGEERVRLRILAAQHLIQSAQVEEGLGAAYGLLKELGVGVPTKPAGVIARLVWDRSVLAVRGVKPMPGRDEPLPAEERARLDAMWSLALPIAWLDPLASAALSSRHLRLALASGEPSHVARALAEEAFARTVQDDEDPQIDPLLAHARSQAERASDPVIEASLAFREGNVATYRWQLRKASEILEGALTLVNERCPEEAWLRTNIRTALGNVWYNVGEHVRQASQFSAWIAEANDRGDSFAQTMLTGIGVGILRHLMNDRPEEAELEIERYHAQWPREPFAFAQLGEMVAGTYCRLYRGGDAAMRWFERELPRLSKAFILRAGMGEAGLVYFHICALVTAYASASTRERPELLARARALAPKLGRVKSAFARATLPGVEVALVALEGQRDRAHALGQQVYERGEEQGHLLATAPMLYLVGVLEGASGRDKCERALAMYASRGWKDPRRAIGMVAPVTYVIEESR